MTRFVRVRFLLASLTAMTMAMLAGPLCAQQPGVQTTKQDCDDYGAGGHREIDTNTTGATLQGRVYDAKGTLRESETDEYSTDDGSKQKTERHILDFNERGKLTLGVDYKFDLKGGLRSLDLTHYGFHSERTWEQETEYRLDGFETKQWRSWDHSWSSDFTTYKMPDAAKPGAEPQTQISTLPTNTNIGVLFPRDFHPGDNITGSLTPAKYAESFKGVPGLSESTFPLQLYHLPDGSPNWSSLEIGVQGAGYFPVTPKGEFSLHIPMDYAGPLKLQTRLLDPVAGIGPSSAFPELGDPVAAPAMPQNMLSATDEAEIQYWMTEDLIDLWNEAFDRENDLDEYYETHATPNKADVGEMKDDLDEVYEDIDSLTARLPTDVVVKLARGFAKKHRDINAKMRAKGNLTADELAEIKEYDAWASFLEDEADAANWIGLMCPKYSIGPFWTSPVLTQSKLGALRGSFSGDSYLTSLNIDNLSVTPLASTPDAFYFLPPNSLTPGLHNYTIDSPGMPETVMPVFYMTLTMWADQLNLRKGQSTTYHVKLDGLNGLPASAWKTSFFSGDLINPSEYLGNQPNAQMPGSSLAGTITLQVTNQSPGTISMMNTFHVLDAKFFAPSGSYQLDGGVGAIMDGSFSILGVARAYLQPEEGLGLNPNAPSTPSYAPASSDWLPSSGWHYTPDSSTGSGFTTHCPTAGAPTADSDSPLAALASTHCMGSTAAELYDDAAGIQHATRVGDTPKTDPVEAARKRWNDAQKKQWAAGKEAKKAQDGLEEKQHAEDKAWDDALNHLPPDLTVRTEGPFGTSAKLNKAEYNSRLDDLNRAEEASKTAKDAAEANPSTENEDKSLRAGMQEDLIRQEFEAYRQKVIENFSKEDRDAWEDAAKAAREAESAAANAETELRDARMAADAAEKAYREIVPPVDPNEPPRIEIH